MSRVQTGGARIAAASRTQKNGNGPRFWKTGMSQFSEPARSATIWPARDIAAALRANLEGWEPRVDAVQHLILPVIALGTISLAIIARITRSSLLEVLGLDYIRTARAKGLSDRVVYFKHALRNALIPIATGVRSFLGVFFAKVFHLPY